MSSPFIYPRHTLGKWSAPFAAMSRGWERGRAITEHVESEREARFQQTKQMQDAHIEALSKEPRVQSYPYVPVGEQGRLFDIDAPEEKKKALPRESASSINAKAKAFHQQLINEGTLPPTEKMQPSRQVAGWANRQTLPKAEGGQGTLFAPRKYR